MRQETSLSDTTTRVCSLVEGPKSMTSTHRPSQSDPMAQINALHASGWSFIKQAENSKSKVKISGLIIDL